MQRDRESLESAPREATRTATTRACCASTRGARSRTPPRTSLPHLRAGARVLDVGSGPGHHHDRPRPARAARHRSSASTPSSRRGRPGGGPRRERAASRTSSSASATRTRSTFDDDSFDVVHAHQVLQHLARPVDALREFRRVAEAGRARRGARRRLRRRDLEPRVGRARPLARALPRRARRATAASPTPGATSSAGRARPASPTSRRPRRRGCSRPRSNASGGATLGGARDRVPVRGARDRVGALEPAELAAHRRGVARAGRPTTTAGAHAARRDPRARLTAQRAQVGSSALTSPRRRRARRRSRRSRRVPSSSSAIGRPSSHVRVQCRPRAVAGVRGLRGGDPRRAVGGHGCRRLAAERPARAEPHQASIS